MKSGQRENIKSDILDEKRHILVVDDDKLILKVAEDILEGSYQVSGVRSGEEALVFLETFSPDLILLDLHMPGMDGRETMNRIMNNRQWKNIPIIFLTADTKPETETECLYLGASDFITKPFVPQVVLSRISRIIELNDLRTDLETRLEKKTKLVEKVTLNSIMAIANTIDAKDTYTSGHSIRVAKCSEEIARRLGWEEAEIQNIHYIALLHDIGKIGIPDSILNKPARLGNEEFAIIKKHPVIGGEILKDIHMIEHVAEGALYHHERYDGKGYPHGLKGEEIPLCARIVGIADAYDAMTSNRVYRSKLSDEQVISEFERCRGTQFDPELTDLFLEMLKEGFHVPYVDHHTAEEEGGIVGESNKLLNKVLIEYTTEVKNNAMRDVLTGLYNRRYAESRITELLGRSLSGAMFMIDLDNFKYVNDTFGHIAGDRALKIFANALLANFSKEDVVCRIGGDEFIVFLAGATDREEMAQKAQAIIDSMMIKMKELDYHSLMSVSIGIAVHPFDGRSYEALYSNADKSLYYVKKNGKNSYCFYSDDRRNELQSATATDLANIQYLIEGRTSMEKGAFHVEYDEFKQLYRYISRCVKRNHQMVQTLLFTLSPNPAANFTNMIPDEAMNALELSIVSSLRMVDVETKYSSVQYIVILMDSNADNGKIVAERVVGKFYKTYAGSDVSLSYDIRTMQPQGEINLFEDALEENGMTEDHVHNVD